MPSRDRRRRFQRRLWWYGGWAVGGTDGRTDFAFGLLPPFHLLTACLVCGVGWGAAAAASSFPPFFPLPSAPPPFDSSSRSRISSSLSPLIPLLLLRRRRPSKQGGHVERGEETKKKASSLSSSSSPWGTTSGYIPCRPLPLSRVPDLRGEGGKGKEPTFLSLSFSAAGRPSVRSLPKPGRAIPPPPLSLQTMPWNARERLLEEWKALPQKVSLFLACPFPPSPLLPP